MNTPTEPIAPTALDEFSAGPKPKRKRMRVRLPSGEVHNADTGRVRTPSPKQKPRKKILTRTHGVRLTSALWEKLDVICGHYDVLRGQVIRKMLEDGVRRYGPGAGLPQEPTPSPNPFDVMEPAQASHPPYTVPIEERTYSTWIESQTKPRSALASVTMGGGVLPQGTQPLGRPLNLETIGDDPSDNEPSDYS